MDIDLIQLTYAVPLQHSKPLDRMQIYFPVFEECVQICHSILHPLPQHLQCSHNLATSFFPDYLSNFISALVQSNLTNTTCRMSKPSFWHPLNLTIRGLHCNAV